MKKTFVLVAAVIFVHCAVFTSLIFLQGCKTTKGTSSSTATPPVMPPLEATSTEPAKPIESTPALPEVTTEIKAEETIEYIVKNGDSLSVIAKRHNASKNEIIDLNKIKDPNKIRVGQKLTIPKRSHAAAPVSTKSHKSKAKSKKSAKGEAVPEKAEATPEPSLAKEIDGYVVQAGDSLSKISSKFKVKIGEIKEANKLMNDKVKVGQKLIIPGNKKSEGAAEAAPVPAVSEPATVQPPKSESAPNDVAPAPAAAATPDVKNTGITHVVLPNEDLDAIAKLYVVSVDDIVVANQMGTNRAVQAGQKIIIPQP